MDFCSDKLIVIEVIIFLREVNGSVCPFLPSCFVIGPAIGTYFCFSVHLFPTIVADEGAKLSVCHPFLGQFTIPFGKGQGDGCCGCFDAKGILSS